MADIPTYFPRPADCGSGWRVCRNKNGIIYQLCDKLGRPITFRTYEGAKRRADKRNKT